MQRHIRTALFALAALAAWQGASAQHTLGFTVGYGMGNGRFQPQQEMRAIWGLYSGGLSWRYYGKQRFVGGFGIDLEFQQQGFSFATNASQVEEKKDYLYYTRHVNSVVLPIVWQPHFYMLRNHVRIYLEAAATFSYNISSTYENEQARANGSAGWKGDYPFKLARDNRWGYGLAGGGGIAFLIRRFELNFRVRYSFRLFRHRPQPQQILRQQQRRRGKSLLGHSLRSPLDNLTISVGVELPASTNRASRPGNRDQEGEEPRGLQIRAIKTVETTRQQKIAKQIQKDVAEIFQKEGAPIVRGSLVTVTAVRISPDFSYAKIYVSIFPFEQSGEVMKRLEHQNWFIRRALGQRLRNQLKNVPEIQFLLDDSLEYIEHIEQALKED